MRRAQPLGSMAAADPALAEIYRYWQSHRDRGLLPRRAAVDIARLAPASGRVRLVEVAGARPSDYRFRPHGSLVWLDRLGEHDDDEAPDLSPALVADYASVALLGVPLYQNVAHPPPAARRYSRLLLPLSEDGQRVSLLAVCTSA